MKKILKYLSVIIVVIAISVTVYVKTSSSQTVEMQNKEALAIEAIPILIPCIQGITGCYVEFMTGDNGHISTVFPAQINYMR